MRATKPPCYHTGTAGRAAINGKLWLAQQITTFVLSGDTGRGGSFLRCNPGSRKSRGETDLVALIPLQAERRATGSKSSQAKRRDLAGSDERVFIWRRGDINPTLPANASKFYLILAAKGRSPGARPGTCSEATGRPGGRPFDRPGTR